MRRKKRKLTYAQITNISITLFFSETMETLNASNHSHALTADCWIIVKIFGHGRSV